jgi:hypothetical protein
MEVLHRAPKNKTVITDERGRLRKSATRRSEQFAVEMQELEYENQAPNESDLTLSSAYSCVVCACV